MPLMHRTGRDRDRPDTLFPFFTVAQALSLLGGAAAASWLWDALAAWPVEWRWLAPFFALLAGLLACRPVVRGRAPLDVARARLHHAAALLAKGRTVDWHA